MRNCTGRGRLVGALVPLLAALGLPAQAPDYNGVWHITPTLLHTPLLLSPADHLRIVAQPPTIRATFGMQFGTTLNFVSAPLEGSLSAPTAAGLSLQTPPSQCAWSYVLTLTFTGPDQLSGILVSTDLYSCFYPGTVVQPFTAVRVPIAMYAPFAVGCPGTAAAPTLTAAAPPSLANGLTVTVGNLPSNLVFVATGLRNTVTGTQTLPLDLAGVGIPGCFLHVSPDSVWTLSGGPTAQWTWTFPNNAGLLGTTFYQQAMALAPNSNPLGALMSDAIAGVIGP